MFSFDSSVVYSYPPDNDEDIPFGFVQDCTKVDPNSDIAEHDHFKRGGGYSVTVYAENEDNFDEKWFKTLKQAKKWLIERVDNSPLRQIKDFIRDKENGGG